MGKRAKNILLIRIANIILLLILATCGNTLLYSQKIDSLRGMLLEHATNDTTLLNIYVELAKLYDGANPDSTVNIGERGLILAEAINAKFATAKLYTYVADGYLDKNDNAKAMQKYDMALAIYRALKNEQGQAAVYNQLGTAYSRMPIENMAMENYKKSLKLYEKLNNRPQMAGVLVNLSYLYNNNGKFPQALDYALKAMRILDETGSDEHRLNVRNNIATIYAKLDNRTKTHEYIGQSIAIMNTKPLRPTVKASSLLSIGMAYGYLKEDSASLDAFQKALPIADSTNDTYIKNIALLSIAQTYLEMKDYSRALPLFVDRLKASASYDDIETTAISSAGIGEIFINQGKPDEGVKYMLVALGILESNNMNQEALEISRKLAEAYEQLHDYKNALKYNKRTHAYSDSLFSQGKSDEINQLAMNYQLDKKEVQIKLLNADKKLAKSENTKQRIISWALIACLLLVIATALLLYRSRSMTIKNAKLILSQKDQIEAQAANLQELNRFKDQTFSVLSHDLKGPLNAFSATLMMLEENIISPEEFATLQPEVNRQLNALNLLVDNLLQWSKSYMKGNAEVDIVTLDLAEIVIENVDLFKNTADRKQLTISNEVPPATYAQGDKGQINIIIRNLVNNALKFSNAGALITIAATNQAATVSLSVTDTGIGMSPAQLDKLFRATTGNSTWGTMGEKGTGLGLLLCMEFAKANNGSLTVNSIQGKGTIFTIILPK